MIGFSIFAGLMVILALCYVLPPLLQRPEPETADGETSNISIYRDQLDELDGELRDGLIDGEQYEQGRLELQRQLLQDAAEEPKVEPAEKSIPSSRKTALILGAAVPLAAVILYSQIGTPQSLGADEQTASPAASEEAEAPSAARQPGAPTQAEIEKRVAGLATRLKENPNDAQGWTMLARSYRSFKRYREASDAYARATELTPGDAQLWADYAESLTLADESGFVGRPLEMVNKALEIDPENQKALWLAGNAAFQSKDYRKAISYWEKLKKLLPADAKAAQPVTDSINEARAQLSQR